MKNQSENLLTNQELHEKVSIIIGQKNAILSVEKAMRKTTAEIMPTLMAMTPDEFKDFLKQYETVAPYIWVACIIASGGQIRENIADYLKKNF